MRNSIRTVAIGTLGACLLASTAGAQDQLGGHFGVVFPLVTHASGETTNIGDDFKMGFPMGITVKTSDRYAFDLEVVPTLDPQPDKPIGVSLTIHPGVLRSLGNSWTAGTRMAFDIGGASWGFTPLFVLPIRFQDDSSGNTHEAVAFGVHLGIGF